MDSEQKEQMGSQGALIIPPYQKLCLKGVENRGGLAQETTGLLATVKVPPKRDTSLEDVLTPLLSKNDHNPVLERNTQDTPIIPPYQKIRLKSRKATGHSATSRVPQQRDTPIPALPLKSVESREGSAPETLGHLAGVKVPPKRDTSLENWMSLPLQDNYLSQIDTFDFSEMPPSAIEPIRDAQDVSARWKILVALVAILVISLIFIGIFGAYLLRPVFLRYLHTLVF